MSSDVDTPHNVEHRIETKDPPVFSKARRLNPEKLKFLKQVFQTLMEQGIIRQSQSAFASPIHFVKKPNGVWRICGDFRKLNAVTIPDRYPLKHIQDSSHNLAGKTVFTQIDLVKAYHQTPIKQTIELSTIKAQASSVVSLSLFALALALYSCCRHIQPS
ncbi:hypothetical protein AVEN_76642-1 [Araneus ventricosus]|uniref:Reverse transcriptase domain-containing protein n=1 Tax=Araneus ventricosus TaxID=182803 RepID=A0A4Y2REP0_ARAVE|nr:hypothetical protein AVEN_76642-1 [Araneus ventricosus]